MTLRLYIFAAAATIFAGLAGYIWILRETNAGLEKRNSVLTILRDACDARIENLTEDKESDNAIDNLPDADLRHVPDGWLLPEAGGRGVN